MNSNLSSPLSLASISSSDVFRPTRRLQDLFGFQQYHHDDNSEDQVLTEIEADWHAIVDAGYSWCDVSRVLEGRVVWLNHENRDGDVFLASRTTEVSWIGLLTRNTIESSTTCQFSIDVAYSNGGICTLNDAPTARNVGIYSDSVTRAAQVLQDILSQLVGSQNCPSTPSFEEVTLACCHGNAGDRSLPLTASLLKKWLWDGSESISSPLRRLVFCNVVLSAEQCRAITQATSFSTRNMELRLERCTFEDDGETLVQILRQSDSAIRRWSFWNGLGMSTNASLNFFAALGESDQLDSLDLFCIPLEPTQWEKMVACIAQSQSIQNLRLFCRRGISNGQWNMLCEALRDHHAIRKLSVRYAFPFSVPHLSEEARNRRTQILLQALQDNHTLVNVQLSSQEHDLELYHPALRATLLLNRYRPLWSTLWHPPETASFDPAHCQAARLVHVLTRPCLQNNPVEIHLILRSTVSLWSSWHSSAIAR